MRDLEVVVYMVQAKQHLPSKLKNLLHREGLLHLGALLKQALKVVFVSLHNQHQRLFMGLCARR